MNISVRGIGWVTAGSAGCARDCRAFEMPRGPLPRVPRQAILDEPSQRFGRLDEYSRTGLAAIAFAMRDAGLGDWETKRHVGVVTETTFGSLATDVRYFDTVLPEGGALSSPNLFAYTLPSSVLGEAAVHFGLTGPTFVINSSDPSATECVRSAWESIVWGQCDTMLAGICDVECPVPYLGSRAVPVGAVYLVLQKEGRQEGPDYGRIEVADDDTLVHNERPVESLITLVQTCLASVHWLSSTMELSELEYRASGGHHQ